MSVLSSPTRIDLSVSEADQVRDFLSYQDQPANFLYQRTKHNKGLLRKLGPVAFQAHLQDLASKIPQSVLFEDSKGFWTYSGFRDSLQDRGIITSDQVTYPTFGTIPWFKKPDRSLRPYQTDIISSLLKAKHGAVEVGTGLGKEFCQLHLAKQIAPAKAVIMAPSKNIAYQLLDEFKTHFGSKYVGFFGDGTKEFRKRFVIAVAASLSTVEESSPEWKEFRKTTLFIADESHQCPAATLRRVCFGLLSEVPYRFFFSGTQFRNDGRDLLLEGIIGPIVYRMTVEEGVDQNYLAKPRFFVKKMTSKVEFESRDTNEMTRAHLLYAPEVAAEYARFVDRSVRLLKRPTVVLIREVKQFLAILPALEAAGLDVRFAYSGNESDIDKRNLGMIPDRFKKPDVEKLVADFNAKKFPVLVGTSCISTGTDLKACSALAYWRGGKSGIEVSQGVGRSTRLMPGEPTDALIFDICLTNVESLESHALQRADIYRQIYGKEFRWV